MGRQEYIDYGDRKVHLSESEFGNGRGVEVMRM